MRQGKFYMIDLFCGAGGMSKGFESSGFECLLGIDNNEYAVKTFERNHRKAIGMCGDIRGIPSYEINRIIKDRKISLICGGPPCQGFSTVGTNDPKDNRNHLFLEFVRIVRDLNPDFIVLENVTGLLSKKNDETLISIINLFTDLGYNIDVKVLSSHYYGVPEKRRRTIFIGNKLGFDNIFPEKEFSDLNDSFSNLPKARTVGWAFKNLISYRGKKLNHDFKSARISNELDFERISHIPEGKSVRYEKDEIFYLPSNLRYEVDWSEIGEKRFRQEKLKRLSLEACSPTINTSKTTYYHPTENRFLTMREAAAIQSFPSNFEFIGSPAQIWKQIGNAVPPLLANAIGRSLKRMMESEGKLTSDSFIDKKNINNIRKYAFDYKDRKDKIQLRLFE